MGSFSWDSPCCLQYHNGRPLSVALTEPCDPENCPYRQSDFALQLRPRSQSSGRRYKRESYRMFEQKTFSDHLSFFKSIGIYHPNVQYASFCYSPPFAHRSMDYNASREGFIEKLGKRSHQ